MKKVIFGALALFAIVALGLGIFIYQKSNTVANDPEPAEFKETSINKEENKNQTKPESKPKPAPQKRTGTFDPRNNEPISGTVSIVGDTIRLEEDFQTNGPDLFVYVGNGTNRTKEVAKLKAQSGAQNYQLPENINSKSVTHVWVWCRAFDVNFGVAELK